MDFRSAEQHKLAIAQNFNRVANTYDQAAILQQEIGKRLLERLDLLTIDPHFVLDLGSGTGFLAKSLAAKYINAHVINLDIAKEMLSVAKQTNTQETAFYLCADGERLPLKNQSIDLILSNCVFQWFANPQQALEEMLRVLKPEGVLFFSTFGPDTLMELRQSLFSIDAEVKQETGGFDALVDMHAIGDWLLQSLFSDPVVDREILTLTYEKVLELVQDLKQTGVYPSSANAKNPWHLKPSNNLHALSLAYENYRSQDGTLPATFEVIYAHAIAPIKTGLHSQDQEGVIRIPINDLHYL